MDLKTSPAAITSFAAVQHAYACSDSFEQAWARVQRSHGMSAVDVKALATLDMPDLYSRTLSLSGDADYPAFTLCFDGAHFSSEYEIDFNHKVIQAGFIVSARGDRMTGRRMFANRALVGLACGIDTLKIEAGDMMGGLIWAKAGGLVHDDYARKKLSDDLTVRAHVLSFYLDDQEKDEIFELCTLRSKTYLWDIADLSAPLIVDENDFNRAMGATNGKYALAAYCAGGFFSTRMTRAQFLLCGQGYNADIHLENPDQMDRLEDYARIDLRATVRRLHPTCSTRHATCGVSAP